MEALLVLKYNQGCNGRGIICFHMKYSQQPVLELWLELQQRLSAVALEANLKEDFSPKAAVFVSSEVILCAIQPKLLCRLKRS